MPMRSPAGSSTARIVASTNPAIWNDATKQALASQGLYEPFDCSDGYVNTAPVDADGFAPHPRGLHHILGNVWEWVADCWYDYSDAPASRGGRRPGLAEKRLSKDCTYRVLRGGSWTYGARYLRASVRSRYTPDFASTDHRPASRQIELTFCSCLLPFSLRRAMEARRIG